jgi:hypothetical protein
MTILANRFRTDIDKFFHEAPQRSAVFMDAGPPTCAEPAPQVGGQGSPKDSMKKTVAHPRDFMDHHLFLNSLARLG